MAKILLFERPNGSMGLLTRDIAPNIFKTARFKKRTISTEMKNNNWIKS
jgi:hypothetical protein